MHPVDQLAAQEQLFRELIKTQEENFRSFVSMHVDSTNKRVDNFMVNVTKDICDLKRSIEFSQAELELVKSQANSPNQSPELPPNITESLNEIYKTLDEFEK